MKNFADTLDHALEHWFRVGGYAVAGICGLGGIGFLLFNPLLGLGLLVCAVAFALFARFVVPGIRESNDQRPFLARIFRVPVRVGDYAMIVIGLMLTLEAGKILFVAFGWRERSSHFEYDALTLAVLSTIFATHTVWRARRARNQKVAELQEEVDRAREGFKGS